MVIPILNLTNFTRDANLILSKDQFLPELTINECNDFILEVLRFLELQSIYFLIAIFILLIISMHIKKEKWKLGIIHTIIFMILIYVIYFFLIKFQLW